MKKFVNILMIAVVAMLLTSCRNTKEFALSDLRSFSSELQANAVTYSTKDWKDAAKDYQKINKRLVKHYSEYTSHEMEEIGQLQGTCAKSFAGAMQDKITGLGSLLQGLAKGLGGINLGDIFEKFSLDQLFGGDDDE